MSWIKNHGMAIGLGVVVGYYLAHNGGPKAVLSKLKA